MKRYTVLILILASITHFNSAQAFFSEIYNWFRNVEQETVSYCYEVLPDATLTLANIKGDITIKTGKKNTLHIEATKEGTEEEIERTHIETQSTKTKTSITTVFSGDTTSCSVHYQITAPETMHLQISTQKGNINIFEVAKPAYISTEKGNIVCDHVHNTVHAKTEKGNISIMSLGLEKQHQIIAMSGKGNVLIKLPEGTDATIDASTHLGTVTSEHTIKMRERKMKLNTKTIAMLKKDVHGSIGSGSGSSIKAHTSKGNIELVTT